MLIECLDHTIAKAIGSSLTPGENKQEKKICHDNLTELCSNYYAITVFYTWPQHFRYCTLFLYQKLNPNLLILHQPFTDSCSLQGGPVPVCALKLVLDTLQTVRRLLCRVKCSLESWLILDSWDFTAKAHSLQYGVFLTFLFSPHN